MLNLFFIISVISIPSVSSNLIYLFAIINFTAIHFSLHIEGRFWNVFSRFHIEQIISHAWESRQRPNEARALRYRIRGNELLNPFPWCISLQTGGKKLALIGRKKKRAYNFRNEGEKGYSSCRNFKCFNMSTKEFIARIFSFPVIPHSADLSFAPSAFLKGLELYSAALYPDILRCTLARLIPRFIVAEDVPRGSTSLRQ